MGVSEAKFELNGVIIAWTYTWVSRGEHVLAFNEKLEMRYK